jgi:hypothetical protein
MDSVIAQGLWCEICDWTLRPSTNLEQHNSGLVHRTLLEAMARLSPGKFQDFRDVVTLSRRKKSKFGLKRELLGAASYVSFFFSQEQEFAPQDIVNIGKKRKLRNSLSDVPTQNK